MEKAAAMLGTRWSHDRMSHRPAQYVRRRKAKGGNCPRAFPWGRGLFLPMNRLAISMRKQARALWRFAAGTECRAWHYSCNCYAQPGTGCARMDPAALSCEREPCMKRFCHDYIFKAVFMLLFYFWPPLPLLRHKTNSARSAFQANAGPEMPDASISNSPANYRSSGYKRPCSCSPVAGAGALMRQTKTETIDLETARRLGRQAGANLVIYGAFNQLGDGFPWKPALCPLPKAKRCLPLSSGLPFLALSECAETISKRAADMAWHGCQPPAQSKAEPGFVPMGGAAYSGEGLTDVRVRGMNVMDPDTVLMRLSVRRGDHPDANAINEEVKRIWDMGYFSDVSASMEGNVLVFTVVENPASTILSSRVPKTLMRKTLSPQWVQSRAACSTSR